MLRYRAIDVKQDKDMLLEFHCRINYESETPYARTVSYEQYRKKWLSTSQPKGYLSHLADTLKDERTMAEILEHIQITALKRGADCCDLTLESTTLLLRSFMRSLDSRLLGFIMRRLLVDALTHRLMVGKTLVWR